MGTRRGVRWLVAAAIVSSAGCDGADDTTTVATTSSSEASLTDTAAPTPATGSLFAAGDIDSGLQPWIDAATADLAIRLGVDPARIEAVSAVLVVWPDSSLGCPEPDTAYDPTPTDGALIELGAIDEVYRYHAGGSRGPFPCPTPLTDPPARG